MSDLLSIGASGVRAYQTALSTTSENIANAGTAGYARRTTTLSEVSATGGGIAARSSTDGFGVTVTGVARSVDAYKVANVRTAGADLARTDTGVAWLDRVQSALTSNQLGDRLTGFFNAAQTLSADPTSTAARSTLLEAGTTVAGAFSATGRALNGVAADLDLTADQATTTLDSLGAALAKVNDGLGRAAAGSTGAAQLGDQRDSILEQMSALSDVNVQTDAAGRATVRLGGSSGALFVAGSEAGHVTYVRSDAGAVSFAVHRAGETSIVTPSGGALAGVADAAQRIADARDGLDQVASAFTDGVNAVQAQGRDLNGNAGAAMFATGGSPSDITLALTDPAGVAAATVGGGSRDNGNLAALQSLRTGGGFEGRVTTLVATNAATLAARKTVADAQSAIRDGAVSARDAVSGVDLDSEAVDLLRFQQAYQASSRVIQVARETMQSILDIH